MRTCALTAALLGLTTLLSVIACGGVVETPQGAAIEGFLELRRIVKQGCPDCRTFELAKGRSSQRYSVAAEYLRLGTLEVERIELNGEVGTAESEQKYAVAVWPTARGRSKIRPFLAPLPSETELLVLAGDDLPVAVISAEIVSERDGFFVFVLPAHGAADRFQERVRPTSRSRVYHVPVDAEAACELVANGDEDLARTCIVEYQRGE